MLGTRQISASCSADDAWVSGDPDQLEQALLNVVRNAVAYTDDGGRIAMTCERTEDTVTFAVTDDGPGIPGADLDRIFDRFYRSHGERASTTGGAGLGLPIAKALVELHEGRIRAENVEPHGARFTIELPAIEQPVDGGSSEG